jgi:hypothetical protein
MRSENLKPQDVLVVCKVFSRRLLRAGDYTYSGLAEDLSLSTSTVHESVERCRRAGLMPPAGWSVFASPLRDLIVHAVPRVFYAVRGSVTVGTPTSSHALVLVGKFKLVPGASPLVWREDGAPQGSPRGESVEPIYPTVPAACRSDNILYELMALADVMRVGGAAERAIAVDILERRLATIR